MDKEMKTVVNSRITRLESRGKGPSRKSGVARSHEEWMHAVCWLGRAVCMKIGVKVSNGRNSAANY